MKYLKIEATKDTPAIYFDGTRNILEIKGESYPENTAEFYAPVFSWLDQYLDQMENHQIVVNMDLIYFNSSSSKILLDFFDLLDDAAQKGKTVTVNWIYEADDEESCEFGNEFQEDFESLKFNLVQKDV